MRNKKTPPDSTSGARKSGVASAFAVLKAFAGARLAVFLALAHARIASEQAVGLERRTEIGVGDEQRARDSVPHGDGLACGAAAADVDAHIEFCSGLRDGQG